jgi:hypothetical protein
MAVQTFHRDTSKTFVAGYRIVRDQSAGISDVLQTVAGRPRLLLALRKNQLYRKVLHCTVVSQQIGASGQSLQIDDIRAMSASPPTAVELMHRRER